VGSPHKPNYYYYITIIVIISLFRKHIKEQLRKMHSTQHEDNEVMCSKGQKGRDNTKNARPFSGPKTSIGTTASELQMTLVNKAIVNSGLRPQSCCHLANFIEMQEIVDCKLDANNE